MDREQAKARFSEIERALLTRDICPRKAFKELQQLHVQFGLKAGEYLR